MFNVCFSVCASVHVCVIYFSLFDCRIFNFIIKFFLRSHWYFSLSECLRVGYWKLYGDYTTKKNTQTHNNQGNKLTLFKKIYILL